MSVTTTTNRVAYTGDGVSVAFTVPFRFLANADIKVYVAGVQVVSGFTTTGAGGTSGVVTFVAAPANLDSVVLVRDPDLLQQTVLSPNDPFPAKTVETMSDKSMLGLQRQADLVTRSFRLGDGDASGASTTIPSPAALQVLRWNAAGTALESFLIASVGALVVTPYMENTFLLSASAAAARTALGSSAVGDAVFVAASAAAARTAIGAQVAGSYQPAGSYAAAGANSDITSLTGLTTGVSGLGLGSKIQPITASVAANALTITVDPTTLDFRSATLGSGTVNTRTLAAAASLVISSGSTLGTVNAVQSRIAVLLIDNAGTLEVAAVNLAGGVSLDETGVISTTAEGGAGAADSATVAYSTTARASVPYRVVGYVESTQATAGTWATAPSTIQGHGGQALASLSSFGNGQTWQTVSGSRAFSTTYYNTTGKPIEVSVYWPASAGNVTLTPTVNGLALNPNVSAAAALISFTVPVGQSYSVAGTGSGGTAVWQELR